MAELGIFDLAGLAAKPPAGVLERLQADRQQLGAVMAAARIAGRRQVDPAAIADPVMINLRNFAGRIPGELDDRLAAGAHVMMGG